MTLKLCPIKSKVNSPLNIFKFSNGYFSFKTSSFPLFSVAVARCYNGWNLNTSLRNASRRGFETSSAELRDPIAQQPIAKFKFKVTGYEVCENRRFGLRESFLDLLEYLYHGIPAFIFLEDSSWEVVEQVLCTCFIQVNRSSKRMT